MYACSYLQAAINIRKGKKIPFVDLTFELTWKAKRPADATIAKGKAKVVDLMTDELDEEFDIAITCESNGEFTDQALPVVQTSLRKSIRAAARALVPALLEKDGDERALAADAAKRAEEAARAEAARTEKGAEKERIAQQAALAEAARKAAEVERAAMAPQPITDAKPKGEGSAWNANSYHWEERNLNEWAGDRMKELLCGFDVDVPAGSLRILDITEMRGDASITVRKGRKLMFFDFVVKGTWEGELVDAEGNVLGTGDGEWEIPDLDQDTDLDDPDEFQVFVKAAHDGGAADIQLADNFKRYGVPQLKGEMRKFVRELLEK